MASRPEVTGRAIARAAFTISEFCWQHGISRATYYNLRKDGDGPDEMRARGRVLITDEASRRWRRRRSAAPVRRLGVNESPHTNPTT